MSARSGTILKIINPAGNCPEHGDGFFRLMEVPALGKNPVIFLGDNLIDHPHAKRVGGHWQPMGKTRTIDK